MYFIHRVSVVYRFVCAHCNDLFALERLLHVHEIFKHNEVLNAFHSGWMNM